MSFSLRSSHFLSQWISALLPVVPPRSRANFIRLLRACLVLPVQTLNLVIDDTLAVRHDHVHKTSRPDFVQAQCWVTLSAGESLFLPKDFFGHPAEKNRQKLRDRLCLRRPDSSASPRSDPTRGRNIGSRMT